MASKALQRLRELLHGRAASIWLKGARVVAGGDDGPRLRVAGPFHKRWLEERYGAEIEAAFGGRVEIVTEGEPVAGRAKRAFPKLTGPAGEFAHRMVRAFLEGNVSAAALVVLHGPPRSGKSVLADWAATRAGTRAFRLDMERLRAGRSRGLVPRKPLVIGDSVEILAGRETPQRTLATIIDEVRSRGDRLLLSLEGHPARRDGIFPGLRNRLLGGVLVPVEAETPATVQARRGLRASPLVPPAPPLTPMKDLAARLFGVERVLLDGRTRRRSVVEARRTIMAAARRNGVKESVIAAAFEVGSIRTVREACRWAEARADKDRRFAALLHEIGRAEG